MARTLHEVLQSTSSALFPAALGAEPVRVDSTDVDGDTPLHVILRRGDTEGALLLIAHGAPVNAVGDMGETPLHVAIARANQQAIDALLAAGARTDIISEFGETASEKARKAGLRLRGRR